MPIDNRCMLGVRRPDCPQQGSRVGRAAAEAGCNRQFLVKVDGAQAQTGRFRAQQRERSVEDICTDDRACERPGDCHLRRGGEIERDAIGNRREGYQALELMIAVGPAAQDLEREVDLGGSELDDFGHRVRSEGCRRQPSYFSTTGSSPCVCAACLPLAVTGLSVSLVRPVSIFFLIFSRSSGSGFSDSA